MNNTLPETGYVRLPQIIGNRKTNPPSYERVKDV
jgi:hypothetical protein